MVCPYMCLLANAQNSVPSLTCNQTPEHITSVLYIYIYICIYKAGLINIGIKNQICVCVYMYVWAYICRNFLVGMCLYQSMQMLQ